MSSTHMSSTHILAVLRAARDYRIELKFVEELPTEPPWPHAEPNLTRECWCVGGRVLFRWPPEIWPDGPFGPGAPPWQRLLHEVAHAIVTPPGAAPGPYEHQARAWEEAFAESTWGPDSLEAELTRYRW